MPPFRRDRAPPLSEMLLASLCNYITGLRSFCPSPSLPDGCFWICPNSKIPVLIPFEAFSFLEESRLQLHPPSVLLLSLWHSVDQSLPGCGVFKKISFLPSFFLLHLLFFFLFFIFIFLLVSFLFFLPFRFTLVITNQITLLLSGVFFQLKR